MINKSTFAFYTFLFSVCISFSSLTAQENAIYEVSDGSSMSKSSSKKVTQNDRADFYELALNLQPTLYVENNSFKKNNNTVSITSKLTFNDAKSFSVLKQSGKDFSEVELITIVLQNESDLNNKITVTQANGFGNLKYIYIKCYFKCTEQQIRSFVTSDVAIRIFYKSETPS